MSVNYAKSSRGRPLGYFLSGLPSEVLEFFFTTRERTVDGKTDTSKQRCAQN